MKTAVTFPVLAVFLTMPCVLFARQGKTMAPAGSQQAVEQPAIWACLSLESTFMIEPPGCSHHTRVQLACQ